MWINHRSWQQEASDQDSWRSSVGKASHEFEAERHEAAKERHRRQKEQAASQSSSAQTFTCPKCSRVCASRIRVYIHQWACKNWLPTLPKILVCKESAIMGETVILFPKEPNPLANPPEVGWWDWGQGIVIGGGGGRERENANTPSTHECCFITKHAVFHPQLKECVWQQEGHPRGNPCCLPWVLTDSHTTDGLKHILLTNSNTYSTIITQRNTDNDNTDKV